MAAPVLDASLLRRAAGVLASLPNGPGLPEARRRLASGLPLAVGLPRAETEKLREALLAIGLDPRIGPAPEGTPPLLSVPPWRTRRALRVLAGLAAVLGLWALREAGAPGAAPSTPPAGTRPEPRPTWHAPEVGPPDVAGREPIPVEPLLELWAQLRASPSGLQLVGWARVQGAERLEPPLALVARAAGREVLSESLVDSPIRTQRQSDGAGASLLIQTVSFRVPVQAARLLGAEEMVLQANWGGWRSAPLVVKVPGGG